MSGYQRNEIHRERPRDSERQCGLESIQDPLPELSGVGAASLRVHSLRGNALVHFPAQYHTQAGRALNPAILREVPAFGSIVAYELDKERRESDSFPTFMSFDLWNIRCPQIGSGMLPPRFAGLDLNTSNVFASFGGKDDEASKSVLGDRWQALERMLEVSEASDADLGKRPKNTNRTMSTHTGFCPTQDLRKFSI